MKPYGYDPNEMAENHGIAVIGDNQRTIAFASVADGVNETINGVSTPRLLFTAAAHGLKKHQYFYIAAGTYAGVWKVHKVVSANTFLVLGTFSITQASNLLLTAAKDGFGFFADEVPITIAELTSENANDDTVSFIATEFQPGVYYHFPFKSIRITGGNITVVRQPIKAPLAYTNR